MSNSKPISPAKIHALVSTQSGTLIVFFTDAHCWQFRILSSEGGVFGVREIFYTAEAAEQVGREWIGKG